ncbi:MAG TPA: hypothetical protein VN047_22025 [Sphingopyxis sp.]|uniref:hypothetical protein n=1 Tax=Sphingopyxis sp. TaxID=1908224 RepID=UPI002CB9155C|nr:hypothetical protein [Sphingopyxis sp.]HWW59583.1 hypothetical protein [Sphingopyxis sp.]
MMRKLFGAQAAILAALLAPLPAAAAESNFTPLDEIDRVRAAACGIDDFDEFLTWYASSTTSGGWLEQVVWTDFTVRVGKLADPADPGNLVDRQRYLGQFRITSRDLRFSREGTVAPRDTPNRHITITRLGKTQYRVDWRGGLGFAGVEGADRDAQAGAYIFEHKKNCWYLTGDLR